MKALISLVDLPAPQPGAHEGLSIRLLLQLKGIVQYMQSERHRAIHAIMAHDAVKLHISLGG